MLLNRITVFYEEKQKYLAYVSMYIYTINVYIKTQGYIQIHTYFYVDLCVYTCIYLQI